MTEHPITPPPELVRQWEVDATTGREAASSWTAAFAARAAQWGADQELEACIDWISVWHGLEHPELLIELLRAALAQHEPPVDGEVAELVAWLRTNADYSLQKAATATFKRFHRIADLLERLAQPTPPSVKEQALEALAHILNNSSTQLGADTIRRALEQLDD
jgi:hypothetical protein